MSWSVEVAFRRNFFLKNFAKKIDCQNPVSRKLQASTSQDSGSGIT